MVEPAEPLSNWPTMSLDKPWKAEVCLLSSFWNMTPPTTTEIAVPRLRTKPKVAVAAAMSRGWSLAWRAIRGAWKLGPAPTPAMIW